MNPAYVDVVLEYRTYRLYIAANLTERDQPTEIKRHEDTYLGQRALEQFLHRRRVGKAGGGLEGR